MKIIVIGMGLMGPTVAKDCLEDPDVETVIGCDIDNSKLNAVSEYVHSNKFIPKRVDLNNQDDLKKIMHGVDVAINCSAAKFGLTVLRCAIDTKVHVVDLAGGGYPLEGTIYGEVEEAGITAIPGCGVDPGLIDILCGQGMEHVKEVHDVTFACGGLPKDPQPPLDYKIVFGGTRMPIRPGLVPMIIDGKITEVPRYTEVESIFIDGYKDMEAFIDGYPSSLLKLCQEKRVRNFKGKTIRYEGYVDKIDFLLELGVIGTKPFNYQEKDIIPLDFFHELIYPIVKFDESKGDRDITVLLARVTGRADDVEVEVTYDMVDEYDEVKKITSMAKTTAYTAAIVARMLARGSITKRGIQWPVRIIREELFEELLSSLHSRGVTITETITKAREV